MKKITHALALVMLAFASTVSLAQELTEAAVQQLLAEVDKAIAIKNVTMLANHISETAEFSGVLYTAGKNQTYHFKKPEYVKMLRSAWPLMSHYKYKRSNQTIKIADGKAKVSADVVESMVVRGSYVSYRSRETATIELVDGVPKLTKSVTSSSL